MNRYLFLDLDGVVNSARYFERSRAEREALLQRPHTPEDKIVHQLDPDAIVHLNAIMNAEPGTKIVISSSWRLVHSVGSIMRALRARGFEYARSIIGKTGYSAVGNSTNRRGLEIQMYLDATSFIMPRRIAILDDDRDTGDLLPFLVHTSWEHGLLAEHVAPTLKMLGIE